MKHNSGSKEDFKMAVQKVSAIVSKMAGIQLGDKQQAMVESRLRSRMARLNIDNVDEYMRRLEKEKESESLALLSLLTTHHTFFFREFNQFEDLLNRGLPALIARARERGDRKIRIWSAACSRGQEVYSLAMFMRFHLAATAPDIDYEIWGTDIDPESVTWARNGVYKASDLKQAPAMYIDGQWIRGQGHVSEFVKVKPLLKEKCHFETVNLLHPEIFLADKKFDLIFCRNVFIYFNPEQVQKMSASLLKHLDEQGLMFLGASETLNGLDLQARLVGPSIYVHAKRPQAAKFVTPTVTSPTVRRILCIDDSPVILTLLKKILIPESGFEVVGTANNGLEALKILQHTKVDAITLDLHMPEMDGLGFLSAKKSTQAPIIVVSSVNRDDMSLAQKALSLGAVDYVEKPSLENLAQAGNEIRSKLKTAVAFASPVTPLSSSASGTLKKAV